MEVTNKRQTDRFKIKIKQFWLTFSWYKTSMCLPNLFKMVKSYIDAIFTFALFGICVCLYFYFLVC